MSPLTQAGRTGRLPHPFGKAVLVAHGCLVYWCVEWQLRGSRLRGCSFVHSKFRDWFNKLEAAGSGSDRLK